MVPVGTSKWQSTDILATSPRGLDLKHYIVHFLIIDIFWNLSQSGIIHFFSFPETDECESNPCEYGSTCNDMLDGYNCTCAEGYTGDNCESGNTFRNS